MAARRLTEGVARREARGNHPVLADEKTVRRDSNGGSLRRCCWQDALVCAVGIIFTWVRTRFVRDVRYRFQRRPLAPESRSAAEPLMLASLGYRREHGTSSARCIGLDGP